jgi:hypothetical protein
MDSSIYCVILYLLKKTSTHRAGAMLNSKNVLSIHEIKAVFDKKDAEVGLTIFDLLASFRLHKLALQCGIVKMRGYPIAEIMTVLLLFPILMVTTVRGFIQSRFALTDARKDTFFRLMNDEKMNWRKLLYAVGKVFRKSAKATDNRQSPECGIIDDTVLEKTGRRIERIGKVFDHIRHRYVLGFRCLVYSFWDGTSIYPLDFSLHAEKGHNKKRPYGLTTKQLKQRFCKDRSPESPGSKRLNELNQDKITAALDMIKRAARHGFVPKYMLTDCWFASDKFISTVRRIRKGAIHFLGMVRQDKRRYVYQGRKYNAKELRQALRTNVKRCRKIRSTYIEAVVEYKSVGKVKLFFSRFSRRGQWQLILTTDMNLRYIKAIETYNIRWGIEVLFKECKQHLNLGKCQSNDFDAQIAETTLSFMLFTMLSFHKRVHAYETLGGIFKELSGDLVEATIAQRLWCIFYQLQLILAEQLGIDPEEFFSFLFRSEEAIILLQLLTGNFPSVKLNHLTKAA